ncbi:Scramblase-domain-containing protein [Suillus clintonianus]|uniref:Scramblase-domain-containing protein n=1 Tax=Suillus clintonianus TaxID=1904413 RepID=UPI001B875765|nr:Scramblase-domain-containing protein [Suillus clintonianus]KAG2139334.1 Scramblase-domain-containing protein [Suillus clintonianus]
MIGLLALTGRRGLTKPCVALLHPAQSFRRGYALSRFPERRTGFGRSSGRKPTQGTVPSTQDETYGSSSSAYEEQPSVHDSQLWGSSQRTPSSNPEEGLKHLLLNNNTLVITRKLEMLSIFMGFEQSNRYTITNEAGEPLGYIAEEPRGILSMFARQVFRTHRPFRALVMDLHGSPILWIRRPFAWINSRMFVQRLKDLDEYTPEGEPVLDTFAEVQQEWHLWRRRYHLFLRDQPRRILSTTSEPQPEPPTDSFTQFSKIDEGLWAWHFNMLDARGAPIATVNRAFRGFGREIFTDTGQYFVTFDATRPDLSDPTPQQPTVMRNLTLDERALVLAAAVNIDYDYFSNHSGGHGLGFLDLWSSGE